MIAAFRRIELNNQLVGEGGLANVGTRAVLRRRDFAGEGPREILAIEDAESLTFQCPRRRADGSAHPVIAAARAQAVARVVLLESKTQGYYREYRLRQPIVDGTSERGLITFTADPVITDLARCGVMREVANGLSTFTFDLSGRTVEEIAQFLVDHSGLSWLSLGDVDAALVVDSFVLSRATPLGGADQLRDVVRARDVGCDRRLVRLGDAGYALAFPATFGSTVTLNAFLVKSGQLAVTRTIDPSQQATRVWLQHGADPDADEGNGAGRARWSVANASYDGGTGRTTFDVSDPAGGAAPIAFDAQWVSADFWYAYRVKSGETWPILASVAAAGASPATISVQGMVNGLADGERIEIRRNEPTTNTRYVRWGDGANTVLERKIFEITAIDGGAKELTLALPWTNADAIAADGQFDGWLVRIHSKVGGPVSATASAAGNYYEFASITGYQVDDWVLPAASASAPYGDSLADEAIGTVDAIDTPNKRLHVLARFRDGADPVTTNTVYAGTRVYRFLRTERVRASVASSNKITLDTVTGLSAGDVLEVVQPDGAGILAPYVEHPTAVQPAPVGYGVQSTDLRKPLLRGVQQLLVNGFPRAWAGSSSSAPDLWTKTGGTIARNTNAAFVRLGGKSIESANWAQVTMQSPVFYPVNAPGRARVSVRVWWYFVAWSDASAGNPLSLLIKEATPAGAGGVLLGQVDLFAPDWTAVPPEDRAIVGAWVSRAINGLELLPGSAPYGLVAEVSGGHPSFPPNGYLGGIEAYGHTSCPELPSEYGDSPQLVQGGNRHLRQFALPETYSATLRNGGAEDHGRRIDTAIGGTVPLVRRDYAINVAHRLVRADIAHLHPDRTQCAFTRRADLLTDLVPA